MRRMRCSPGRATASWCASRRAGDRSSSACSISGEMPRGMIFVPIHWSGAFASDARVGALVNPVVDPVSGEPEFKHTPARVAPFVVSWYGFVLCAHAAGELDVTWWTLVHGDGIPALRDRRARVPRRLVAVGARAAQRERTDADWLEYSDRERRRVSRRVAQPTIGSARASSLAAPDLPSRTWLAALFASDRISDADRVGLLMRPACRSAGGYRDRSCAHASASAATRSATRSRARSHDGRRRSARSCARARTAARACRRSGRSSPVRIGSAPSPAADRCLASRTPTGAVRRSRRVLRLPRR